MHLGDRQSAFLAVARATRFADASPGVPRAQTMRHWHELVTYLIWNDPDIDCLLRADGSCLIGPRLP